MSSFTFFYYFEKFNYYKLIRKRFLQLTLKG